MTTLREDSNTLIQSIGGESTSGTASLAHSTGYVGYGAEDSFSNDAFMTPGQKEIDEHTAVLVNSAPHKRGASIKERAESLHERASITAPTTDPSPIMGEASMFSCVVSLTNSVVGAGMLSLPYSVSKMGLIPGVTCLLLGAFIGLVGCFLAMMASKTLSKTGTNFSDLGWKTLPRAMKYVDFLNFLGNITTIIGLLIIIGGVAPPAFQGLTDVDEWYTSRWFVMCVYALVFLVPTIPASKFDNLKFVNILAIVCFAYLFCAVVLYAVVPPLKDNINKHADTGPWFMWAHSSPTTFISVLPIVLFAFATVQNAVPITHELENNTVWRLTLLLIYTYLICSILFVTIAVCGYLTFGRLTKADLLENYATKNIVFNIVRIGLSIAMSFSYPLWLHPTRENVFFLVFGRSSVDDQTTWFQYYFVTYGLFGLSLGVSLLTSNLGLVMALSGAVSATTCLLIVPGLLFYYRCTPNGGPMYSPFGDSSFIDRSTAAADAAQLSMVEEDVFEVGFSDSPGTRPLMKNQIAKTPNPNLIAAADASKARNQNDELEWNVWPAWVTTIAMIWIVIGVISVPLMIAVQFL